MRVLVTGGGGYLGSWLCEELLDSGHQVRVFDRFCFGQDALEGLTGRDELETVNGDIRRLQEHPELLEGVDAIVHLASLSNDPSCNLDTDMATDVNVESTLELARQAVECHVPRFVLASSCLVYGRGVFELLDEESPANPVSTFGQVKLAAERGILQMKSAHFEPTVARVATTFGWSNRMRFDLAVNQMVASAMLNKRIIVRGGGKQWRPFVHVRDAARALLVMTEADAELVSGEIFNTGSDLYNTTIIDLAHRIAGGFDGVEVEVPKDDDDLRSFRVQFGKIRERLNFSCRWSIDEGVQELKQHLTDSDIDPFDGQYFNVARMKELLDTPVAEGGEPVATRFIPLSKPNLGPEEEQAVVDAFRSGWLTSGPQVKAFEQAFSETVAADHTVGVSSCTAALHLCLIDAGVGPGDEVITSPITWASTGNTVLSMGAKPVFVDIDPHTLNIRAEAIEAAITERTRAIMPVHIAGLPCELEPIYELSRRTGIPVVEDAAHALGAAYRGTPIGGYGDMACFSFYAIKNITTMEGGMVALKDGDRAERLRLLARNGMGLSAWDRYGRSAVTAPTEVLTPGHKYALGNVSAAIGVEQLKKFDAFKAARRRLAQMYRSVLADIDEITLPEEPEGLEHAWHLFIIRFHLDKLSKTRNELAYELRRENVGTGVHFYGLHLHEYYRETLGMKPEDFPEATKASDEIISLPLHPLITDRHLHQVVSALKKVIAHSKK